MSVRITLLGEGIAEGADILRQKISGSAETKSVSDPTKTQQVEEALNDAQIVVSREWSWDPDKAPNVKLVHSRGAGTDNFNKELLPSNAYLCNVYGHGKSIAEHVLLLALALRRNLISTNSNLQKGIWLERKPVGNFHELTGGTLGIVGYGHIGREVTNIFEPFSMDMIAIKRRVSDADTPEKLDFLGGPDDIDKILTDSDIIILAVPLTDETEGMIGRGELQIMKKSALLINVGRGPLIQEEDLFTALKNKEIRGAGIDTWYQYPQEGENRLPSRYSFQELENIIMTPHIAGTSKETFEYRWQFIASNINRFIEGKEPRNIVWKGSNSDK